MMKVYCKDCKFLEIVEITFKDLHVDFLYNCNSFNNEFYTSNWLEKSGPFKKSPYELNENNDCRNFMIKEEKIIESKK